MGAVRMRGRTADKNITIIHKYDSSPFFDVRGKEWIYWRKCGYGLWAGVLARYNGLKLKRLNKRFVPMKKQAHLHIGWLWTIHLNSSCMIQKSVGRFKLKL